MYPDSDSDSDSFITFFATIFLYIFLQMVAAPVQSLLPGPGNFLGHIQTQ
jgi:hypothetical protein